MLTCPELEKLPNIRHGFFTRNGGVSSGIYTSLNCGPGSGDDLAAVAENRKRVADTLDASTLLTCHQIHSDKVVIAHKPWETPPQADAIVTQTPGIAIGILTADCLPILLAGNGVIGAAHAGWKGAIGGVIEATISAMQSLGAKNITATIGPAIAQYSYEVGEEFHDRFIAESPDNRLFFVHSAREHHYMFDLPAYAKTRLTLAGIENINLLAHDTCLLENDFFSYRRATLRGETAYGRQVSAITLEAVKK